jgi:hypothetical protein
MITNLYQPYKNNPIRKDGNVVEKPSFSQSFFPQYFIIKPFKWNIVERNFGKMKVFLQHCHLFWWGCFYMADINLWSYYVIVVLFMYSITTSYIWNEETCNYSSKKDQELYKTWWSYRYMFLVSPKVFSFVIKGVKVIFWGVQRGWGLL